MEKILFLAHTESDGSLSKQTLEALTAAQQLKQSLTGASLSAGLLGGDIQSAADSIASCGAERILSVSGQEFDQPRYATDAAGAEALARAAEATVLIAGATSRWSRVLAGVAHRLGGRIDTHVTAVTIESNAPLISRWYYRQRMFAQMKRTHRPWVMTIDSGSYPVWQGENGKAQVAAIPVATSDAHRRTRVTGIQSPASGKQTIRPDAELLFVAGAGWTKTQRDGKSHIDDAEKLILGFLQNSQASLGGSKSLVDLSGEGQAVLSFMTHLNQVGQTGSTPRHPKGLATCCHGEEPHVVGWRFINERRAINLDPNCGWAQGKADVLYVADAFEVMSKVNALLESQ